MAQDLVTYRSNEINDIWEEIEPLIKTVCKKTEMCYTIDIIKEFLLRADMQLWTSYNGTQISSICITQVSLHPKNYKYLEIILMAGERYSLSHLEKIKSWAKELGCSRVNFTGRKGWAVLLPEFKKELICYTLRL